MGNIILTGDRPTGRLHIGHYVGSLKERVALQNKGDYDTFYVMIADAQALTDNAENPEKVRNSVIEVMLDYLAVGLDPAKVTFFIQSSVKALPELTAYYMNFVPYSRVVRNPTVKSEIKTKDFGRSVPIGFINYPVSQAADITAFKANLVPVGEDQEPMLEQTREIVRTFNRIYKAEVLKECKAILPDNKACLRLPGTDGNEKMSKSIGNCIYLADDAATIKKKVNSIVTFPREIEAPGILDGNVLFIYLDAFCVDDDFKKFYPEFENLAALKEAYAKGGIGDGRIKQFLFEVLDAELEPIRERRAELAKNPEKLMEILKEGTKKANLAADQTLTEVKQAMGINYFGA
ncbi:MAG: tryptophan--tRNA ligase [Candidatus Saccharibacteria bacterium]|nr:tryptophan--tRNA ligase [Candidatus Saccharibacteria bacterium]